MEPSMTRSLLAALLALAATGTATAATYKIDPRHTQVFFTYAHNEYSNLSARLNEVSGSLEFDPAKPAASSISLELPLSSLSTGVPGLDEHMKSADFFDAEKFPKASFRSTKVSVKDATHFDLSGELTIKGVTKPATFAVTINHVGENPRRKTPMAGFDATATIKRSEFGVDNMLGVTGDEIRLRVSMEAGVPAPEPAPGAAPPPPPAKG
jgi:polyisoprenoid-binding protein YceI